MGTRGKFGFFYKGKYYTCYNHSDSYPSYLGVHLILEIIHADLEEWIKLLENIKEVSEDVEPTPEDIKKLEEYTDLSVSNQSTADWYCLLKLTQGSFHHVLHSGYMENVEGINMSEDYTYVLDLDNRKFRAFGGVGLDVSMDLEINELVRFAREWSKDELDEDYDPEEQLAKTRELADWMKKELQSFKSGK